MSSSRDSSPDLDIKLPVSNPRDSSPEWDKSTASIASLSSDELYDSRPNRWRGSRSTWRTFTQEDRSVYEALEARRRGDLAVHLYNAFALKGKRRRIGPGGELGDHEEDEGRWAPPRGWAAWPVNLHDLPPEDFMPAQPLDEDSSFTYKKRQRVFPRDALAGEIEAGILRFANAKFRARGLNVEENSEVDESTGDAVDTEMRDSVEDHEDLQSDANTGTGYSGSEAERKPKRKSKSKFKSEMSASEPGSSSESEDGEARWTTPELRGVPAADDDVSSAILKPAVSDIVTKLEKTLTVLHNMMVSTVQTVDDEDDSEDETGVDEPPRTRSTSRFSRTRSRSRRRVKRPRSDSEFPATDLESEGPFSSPQKKARYASVEDDENGDIEEAEAKDAEDGDEEDEEGEGEGLSPPARESQPTNEPPPAMEEHHPPERILRRRAVRLNRLAPRNWRAVLGAASLAGFPQSAILRATQRCADLFGEGAETHLLNDHSPIRDTRKSIVPGGGMPSVEDEDRLAELGEVTRMKLAARDASRVEEPEQLKSRSPSPAGRTTRNGTRSQTRSRTPAPRRSHTPSGSRSRSRSRSATPHLRCPYRSCPRSVEPFSRRGNLVRHIEIMHGGEGLGMDVDSEDEVEGGVHVDGFLKPVRVRRGWRGEDFREEERGRGAEKERGRGVERRGRGRGRRAKVEDDEFGTQTAVFGAHDHEMNDILY